MSNLLEKASIVTTPTAYDNGKILSVKPAPSLGSELVTNGGFDTDSGWNKQTSNWIIINGYAVCDGLQTSNSSLFQDVAVINGKSYRIDFTITNSVNNLNLILGATTIGQYGSGTHSIYVTKDANASARIFFQATASNNFSGSIDNVSVKQAIDGDFDFTRNSSATRVGSQGLIEDVQILSSNLVSNGDFSQEGSEQITNGDFATDSDWILGSGWNIGGGKAVAINSASGQKLRQAGQLTASKTYKLVYEVTEITLGGFLPIVGAVAGTAVYSIGTYTEYITTINNDFYIRTLGTTSGSIDNVSVKEVGQDWTLVGDFKIGNNQSLITNASQYSQITNQIGSTFLTANRLYKLSADIPTLSISNVLAYRVTGGAVTPISTSQVVNGKFEAEFIMPSDGYLWFQTTGSYTGLNVTISNVSVIEITSDTNLPRINYEGFSYQDALGSELVLNGGFTDGTNGWSAGGGASISVSNNQLTIEGNNDFNFYARQAVQGFEVGKQYKIEIDVAGGTTSKMQVGIYGEGLFFNNQPIVLGKLSVVFTITNGSNGSRFLDISNRNDDGLNDTLIINSLSVKEYLGQEVVPDSGRGHWLFEPQSTNKIIYSEDFTQWNKSSAITITSNAITSPSGALNATLLSTTTTNRFIYLSASSIANSTFSIYVKWKNGSGDIDLSVDGASNYTSVSVTSEWTRVSITPSSSITQVVLRIPTASELYVWGAQVEAQTFATSYIPTNGEVNGVTRLQDAAFGAGSSDLINSTEGVLYAEIAALANDGNYRLMSLSDGTANNRIYLGYMSTDDFIRIKLTSGAVTQADFVENLSNATSFNKVAFKYKENDFALWINGIKVATDTSGLTPVTLTDLSFNAGSSKFFGKTKCVAVFKEALTDAELTCLTTI